MDILRRHLNQTMEESDERTRASILRDPQTVCDIVSSMTAGVCKLGPLAFARRVSQQ